MAKTIGKMRAVRANPAPDLTILRSWRNGIATDS